ncbi:hypothetical protein [Acetivibrio straminisolvens]|nr:hypothetical protein [Acetivibrio straminisolvens]
MVVKRMIVEEVFDEKTAKPAWAPPKGKINLAWDMIYSRREDHSSLGEMKGLDVISLHGFR